MNLLLAAVGRPPAEVDAMVDAVVATYGVGRDAVALLGDPAGAARLGVLSDGGGVLGRAGDGSVALAAVGSFARSWPAGDGGRPTGDPDRAAAWLLDRYRTHGDAFLDGVPGEWAVVVVDSGAGRLHAATSANQFHRLFVADRGDGVVLSTQLVVAGAALGEDLRVDRSYEDFLLGWEFLPDGRTVYRGVRTLPGGALHSWPGASRPIAPPAEAWDGPVPATEAEAVDALYTVFMDTLAEQAGVEQDQAVLLGGFDSALVAAGLHRLGRRVTTFTFHFEDPTYNQRNTDVLARHLGSTHVDVPITAEVIGEGLARYSAVFNQPGHQPHYQLHTVAACAEARRRGFVHALTGDGCDNVFLGYPTVHRRATFAQRLGRVPAPVLSAALRAASPRVVEDRLGHVWRMGYGLVENLRRPWPTRGHLGPRVVNDLSLRRLRVGAPPPQAEPVDAVLDRLAAGLDDVDPYRLAFRGKGLSGQSKTKVEGASAWTGVAMSSPYLHGRVKSFATALPVALLRPGEGTAAATGKYVLMRMAEEKGLLPAEIVHQPKQSPVDSPVDRWYAGPLRDDVLALLDGLPFAWDRRYVEGLLRRRWAEDVYREKVSIGHYADHVVGILASYASFTARAG
ncbi:MAG TPA: asparagine synthase-related protein [Acidimicrobiales bacterium]